MLAYGHRFASRRLLADSGAVTIAELLVVLVLSMILLIAVLSGQSFVDRLARRFFTATAVETEARLLLQRLEEDFTRAETLIQVDQNKWELRDWLGTKTTYAIIDSAILRDEESLLVKGMAVEQFRATIDTIGSRGESTDKRVKIAFTLSHRGGRLTFEAIHPLRQRAPGS